MRYDNARKRHIEAEICAYHETRRWISRAKQDIIDEGMSANYSESGVRQPGHGISPTERRAARLYDDLRIRELERILRAISETYLQSDAQARQVVWIKYGLMLHGWYPPREWAKRVQGLDVNRMSVEQMCDVIHASPSTFHLVKGWFVEQVGKRLGWL